MGVRPITGLVVGGAMNTLKPRLMNGIECWDEYPMKDGSFGPEPAYWSVDLQLRFAKINGLFRMACRYRTTLVEISEGRLHPGSELLDRLRLFESIFRNEIQP